MSTLRGSLPSVLDALDKDDGDLDKLAEGLAISSDEPLTEPRAALGAESLELEVLEPVLAAPACEIDFIT